MSVSKQPYSNGYDEGHADGYREGFDAGQEHNVITHGFMVSHFAGQIEHWKSLLREAIDELRERDFNNEKAHDLIELLEEDDNDLDPPKLPTKDEIRNWWTKPKESKGK